MGDRWQQDRSDVEVNSDKAARNELHRLKMLEVKWWNQREGVASNFFLT